MFGPEAAARHAYPALAAAATHVFDLIRESIAACQKEGILLNGTPDEHALFCWSAVHGFASLMVERQVAMLHLPPADPETLSELIVLRIFTGLAANPAYQ